MADTAKLSISNVLRDPLVRQMMRADGVQPSDLAALMEDVAARLEAHRPRPESRRRASIRPQDIQPVTGAGASPIASARNG